VIWGWGKEKQELKGVRVEETYTVNSSVVGTAVVQPAKAATMHNAKLILIQL
jgi:hypothetical protein